MGWLWSLIIGGVIGWLAGMVMGRDIPGGVIGNVIAGFVGSWIGGMLFPKWGPIVADFAVIPALLGAIILIAIVSFILGRSKR